MRAEIPENAGGREVRHFAPGAGFRIQAEAVEARLVFHDRAQHSRLNQFSYCQIRAIPAAVLIDGEQQAALLRNSHKLLSFFQCRSHWLVDDNVASSFKSRFGVVGVTFENACEFHTLDAANHGGVKCLTSQTESDKSDANHRSSSFLAS